MRARVVIAVLLGTMLLSAIPVRAQVSDTISRDQLCKPVCAGGGAVTGANLSLPDVARSFEWGLSFRGATGGVSESARQLVSVARMYGWVESAIGSSVSGSATMAVYREDGSALVAVALRFTVATSPAADGTLRVDRGALTQVGVGSGYGATIHIQDGTLTGIVHAPRVLEERGTAVVATVGAPARFVSGEPVRAAGTVETTNGLGLPGVPVDVLVDGDYRARVTTDGSGGWAYDLTFSDAVAHSVRALAFADTPAPIASDRVVIEPTVELTVSVSGAGTVTGPTITCTSVCSYPVARGSQITLTAAPDASSTFDGWSGGGCSGTGTCVVTMTSSHTVAAAFALKTYPLTAAKAGSGTGTVTSSPAGISCGGDCMEAFTHGTTATLTASPDVSSTFSGWSGSGCSGTGTCVVTMTAARTVTSLFTVKTYGLTVARTGSGTGTVTSAPTGISCGGDCAETFAHGTAVTLTASPDVSSTFTGWSGGGCSGTGTCVVTLTSAQTVTATFTLKTYVLTVVKAGNGAGSVTSSPAGISCGGDCTEAFAHGTSVTLTVSPDVSSFFAGWSGGGCSGTGTCAVPLTSAQTVTATFTMKTYVLTVSKGGTGTGSVTSSPGGISCGADCTESYAHGTTVTVTASAGASSTFTGWSGGGCSGTGTCVVSMTAARTVTATFAAGPQTLTVTGAGAGSGTVISSPAGISCGATCVATFPYGTTVTLTATPDLYHSFEGWSGSGCSGTGNCTVSMTAARSVTATFAQPAQSLVIVKAGSGDGVVTSTPAGIDCGSTCSAAFPWGQSVDLTTSSDAYSTFSGWSGACSGSGTCTVSMTTARSVTATFAVENADIVESEPNDTIGSADPVSVPVVVAGAIPNGDVDLVTFTLSSWTTLHVQTYDESLSTCDAIDTIVRVLDTEGTPLAEDDDSGTDLCSSLDITLAPGTYLVGSAPFGSTSVSEYRLQITDTPLTAAHEPNDSIATAASVGPGSLRAAISPGTDLDHYEITLLSSATLVAETYDGGGTGCAGIDTVIAVFDENGVQVDFDDDGGISLCSRTATWLAPGTYTIKVEDHLNDSVIDAYTLSLAVQPLD